MCAAVTIRSGIAVYYTNSAGDVPIGNALIIGCSRSKSDER
jgi:hypothetical protein